MAQVYAITVTNGKGPATEAAGQVGSMTLCNKQKDAVFPAASPHPGQG